MTHRAIKLTAQSYDLEEVQLSDLDYPDLNTEMFGPGVNIEIVHPRGLQHLPGLLLVVDEDGLGKELPMNLIASYLYGTHDHGSPIVGDAYVLAESTGYDDGELRAVPEEITFDVIYAAMAKAILNPAIFR